MTSRPPNTASSTSANALRTANKLTAGLGNRTGTEDLMKITGLNRLEIEALIKRFNTLATPQNDKIDRARFRDLISDHFGIDDSLLMDRVFRCFDMDTDNYINYDEFIKGMSVFLKGTFEERMKFCFRVYDLNSDKYITREEMFQMLKNCLVRGAEEDEDGVKDLVDLVLKKLDEDRDGRVNEADYVAAVQKENLLLEAFGQCLPTPRAADEFLGIEHPGKDDFTSGSSLSATSSVGTVASAVTSATAMAAEHTANSPSKKTTLPRAAASRGNAAPPRPPVAATQGGKTINKRAGGVAVA